MQRDDNMKKLIERYKLSLDFKITRALPYITCQKNLTLNQEQYCFRCI